MALGDITFYDSANPGLPASERYAVAASATTIKAGEPVSKALGDFVVTPMATNKPVVATDFLAGIAASTSTNTAGAAGVVDVFVLTTNQTYLIAPNVAASWDTQAEYDALVGDRVLIDLTTSSYTILATDGATSGCVIMPLNIAKFPAKVRFTFRGGVNYLS